MKRFLAVVFSAVLAAAPAHAQLTKEAVALNTFAGELDRASMAPDFVGLAVAVVKDGKVALIKTYGVREAGGKDAVTPDTVFRVASLSKGFAGTLAAMEAGDGKLDLSSKAVSYVPQFALRKPSDTAAVTLEDVLTHRTGLPPYAYDNLLEAGVSPDEILSRYKSVRPTCGVHDCFTYQNTTFNMIATAIEKVAGRSYEAELQARILDPLGMTATSLGQSGLISTGNWARPHRRSGSDWYPVPVKDPYYKVPAAGGVNSSVSDLAKWMIAQMGERPDVISRAALDEAHRKRVSTPSENSRQRSLRTPVTDTYYGLGWRTYTYAGHKLINHTGSVEGYYAHIAWLPDRKNGIVVLSNSRGSRVTKIVPTWLDHELGLTKTDWFRLDEIPLVAEAPPLIVPAQGD
jgi:beta-lactamase class C